MASFHFSDTEEKGILCAYCDFKRLLRNQHQR